MIRFFGDKILRHHWGGAFGSFVGRASVIGGSSGDVTAPTLIALSTPTSGAYIDAQYGESLDPTSIPATGDGSVTVPCGSAPAISGVSIVTTTLTNDTVRWTLATPLYEPEADSYGSGVQFDYTPGSNPIRDVATNNAAALVSQAVTNNSTVWPLTANGSAHSPEGGTIAGFKTDLSGNGNDIVTSNDPSIDASTYGAPVVDWVGASAHEMTPPSAWSSAINGAANLPVAFGCGLRIEDDTTQVLLFSGVAFNSSYSFQIQCISVGRLQTFRRDATATTQSLVSNSSAYPKDTWETLGIYYDGTTLEYETGTGASAGSGTVDVGATTASSNGIIGDNGAGANFDGQTGRMWFDAADMSARDRAVMRRWTRDYTAAL